MQSKAQMRLMYAAASHKGGAGGVSQSVAKEFVAAGKAEAKLPEHVAGTKKKTRREKLYG